MILTLAVIVAAYLYAAAVCWRVGHSGKHGKQIWSTPRPDRMFHHGSHARPRTPEPTPNAEAEPAPTGLAVAA